MDSVTFKKYNPTQDEILKAIKEEIGFYFEDYMKEEPSAEWHCFHLNILPITGINAQQAIKDFYKARHCLIEQHRGIEHILYPYKGKNYHITIDFCFSRYQFDNKKKIIHSH